MSLLDTGLMAQLDDHLAGLSAADKACFFEALQVSAAAARRGAAVDPTAITALADACDDWMAVQTALTALSQLAAGLVQDEPPSLGIPT